MLFCITKKSITLLYLEIISWETFGIHIMQLDYCLFYTLTFKDKKINLCFSSKMYLMESRKKKRIETHPT